MPAAFFTGVVALSIPLWILGALPQSELRNLLPFNLPISVLAAIVFHAMTNVSDFMFPVNASYYDPFVTGIFVLLLAAVALRVMPRGATRRSAP